MSRSLKYVFPAQNATAVAILQSTVAAANIVLNGSLVDPLTGQVSFIKQGYIRNVSITCGANISARTFTVTGFQNGVAVTENITGPNATTVYGTTYFDIITNININGAAANFSIGTGASGYFPLIGINLERGNLEYSLTVSNPGGLYDLNVYTTLVDVFNNGEAYEVGVASDQVFETVTNSDNSELYRFPAASAIVNNAILVELDGDGTSVSAAVLNFRQI